MAKNAPSTPTASENSSAEVRKPIAGTEPIPRNEAGGIDFDAADGEAFVGLNILDLHEGAADGPFKLVNILPTEFGVGKGKKLINVYHTMKGTTPVQMPISASFITKAEEAKLQKGDTFLVKRGNNFKSREFGTENCKSYLIKVTARA